MNRVDGSSSDQSSEVSTPREAKQSSPIDKKVENSAKKALKETRSAEPDKKSIAGRLEKNRKFALEQQEKEAKKGFVINDDEVPANVIVRTDLCCCCYCTKISRPISAVEIKKKDRRVALASCQGRRGAMEDESLSFKSDIFIQNKIYIYHLLGIFDGHGYAGAVPARFVKTNLAKYLKKEMKKQNKEGLTDGGIFKALKATFINLNNHFPETYISGTTAVVAMIINKKIWIANVGDSRAVLVKNGQSTQASEDAKPPIPRYKKKIEALYGRVYDNRVNGVLAVARSIGNKECTGVIPNPKITCYPLKDYKDGYLVLACDGLFDVASTDEIGKAIATMEEEQDSLVTMSKKLVYHAFKNKSQDNISVVLATL